MVIIMFWMGVSGFFSLSCHAILDQEVFTKGEKVANCNAVQSSRVEPWCRVMVVERYQIQNFVFDISWSASASASSEQE